MTIKRRLARWLRSFVERHDPVTLPEPGQPFVPGPGQTRYRITRKVRHAPAFTLYDGPDDQEAARRWETVVRHRERGSMTWHENDATQPRCTYEGPA